MIAFKEEGLPGVGRITEANVFSWFNLYMTGRTYQEIARETKGKLEHILYMSDHHDWPGKRQNHYANLMSKIENKMTTAKIEGVSFLYDLLSVMTEVHKNDIVEFLSTKNPDAAARIDFKIIDRYVKAVDAISKLTATPEEWLKRSQNQPQQPTVNINIEQATISNPDNSVLDIKSGESMISKLADLKKQKESSEQ